MARILAIDSGLTVTKAVLFDLGGRQLAVARRNVPQLKPRPRMVERDMNDLWNQTASAIQAVLRESATDPSDIISIAATGHGDGIYLLDHAGLPLGNAILSLDSRGIDVIARWQTDGTARKSLALTGQIPHASAPSTLLEWIRLEEPERFARIGHILTCKDWLRYCLTGTVGTDRTEASTSFTDVRSQTYSSDAMALFGLAELRCALPQADDSAQIVGSVTGEAAALSGLKAGTPVAAGLHDVTASALGIGAHRPGVVGVVAGTYSINECVTDAPQVGERWYCRNAVAPGYWNNMSISPASATNYDWFIDTFCAAERDVAEAEGSNIHVKLAPEIAAALERPSPVVYHPYLFGSPMGAAPSAGFLGLRGWHERGDLLAALLEGVVFNHRQHIDALREKFTATEVRLTGGASRNPTVGRLFADVLDMPVTVTQTDEAAAWGAALCAGAAVGKFDHFDADPRDLGAIAITYEPVPARSAHYQERFLIYRETAVDLAPIWNRLNDLEDLDRGNADD